MKHIILPFTILIFNIGYSQKIKNIPRYYNFTDTINHIIHFKVKSNSFAFSSENIGPDSSQILFIGDTCKILCPKDSMQMLEVYADKFLMVNYYSIEDAYLAYGVGFRPKERLLIIDLANPKRRWLYNLNRWIITADILSFDDKTGALLVKRKIAPRVISK